MVINKLPIELNDLTASPTDALPFAEREKRIARWPGRRGSSRQGDFKR
jgi:hypothetical protein